MAVKVPVDWLASRPELPDRCARHGLPAVRRVDFVVKSRPKISSRRRLLLPWYTALDRADEYLQAVKFVRVAAWPLCARCVRTRRAWLSLAGVLFFGGLAALLAAFVVGAVLEGPQPLLLIPILAGFAAVLLSPIGLARGGLPRLTGTETTSDGTAVLIAEPHPDFATRVDPLKFS